MSHLDHPLSDAEFAELDQFLMAGEDEGCMPIDQAHGFITALVVGPEPLGQESWTRAVWGEAVFEDEQQKTHMTDFLLRIHNEIMTTLEDRRPFEPLIIEEEDEEGELLEAYEGWCLGFMHGVSDHHDQWDALPKNEQELLSPIAKLALLCVDEEMEMDEEEYEMCVELLPGAVMGLYEYWHGRPA